MSSESKPNWYLELNSQRTGPFTSHQIEVLFRDGQILPAAKVSGRGLRGSVVVQEFIAALEIRRKGQASPSAPIVESIQKAIPARPTDLEERRKTPESGASESAPNVDPAEALFDALQVVRERALQQRNLSLTKISPQNEGWMPNRSSFPRLSPQLLTIGSIAAVLFAAIWGSMQLIHSKNSSSLSANSGSATTEKVSAGRNSGIVNEPSKSVTKSQTKSLSGLSSASPANANSPKNLIAPHLVRAAKAGGGTTPLIKPQVQPLNPPSNFREPASDNPPPQEPPHDDRDVPPPPIESFPPNAGNSPEIPGPAPASADTPSDAPNLVPPPNQPEPPIDPSQHPID